MFTSIKKQKDIIKENEKMLKNNQISVYNAFNQIDGMTYLFKSGKYTFNDFKNYCKQINNQDSEVQKFISFIGWVTEGNVLRAFGMTGK